MTADEWNEKYPIGQHVALPLFGPGGNPGVFRTEGPAFSTERGRAAVKVRGLRPEGIYIDMLTAVFRCPKCKKTSANPNDLREGYCGACHDWTGKEAR